MKLTICPFSACPCTADGRYLPDLQQSLGYSHGHGLLQDLNDGDLPPKFYRLPVASHSGCAKVRTLFLLLSVIGDSPFGPIKWLQLEPSNLWRNYCNRRPGSSNRNNDCLSRRFDCWAREVESIQPCYWTRILLENTNRVQLDRTTFSDHSVGAIY